MCDNLKYILQRPFKFGMWLYCIWEMPQRLLYIVASVFNYKTSSSLLKIKLGVFLHILKVLTFKRTGHPMADFYNIYICPL